MSSRPSGEPALIPRARRPISGLEALDAALIDAAHPELEPEFRGKIRTGTDVVHYYATYGQAARVQLFHALHKFSDGALGNPYELVIVPKDILHFPCKYATISAAGVVEVTKEAGQSEFTPLGLW